MAAGGYRPEIDGLRALAVVAVVMFHLGSGFPGGFVGVDVFFVLSGFLITGIIRRGLENGTFSLAEFWERRIRRIFPALFVMIVATLAGGYWLLIPPELEELGKSSVAQALLLANVYFWRDTGYFAGPAEYKPLLHTWSLAVEEQFYLFFPLLLVFFKRQSGQRLFWFLMGLSILSLGSSIYGTKFHPDATFFLLPTRAWELLVGCMLAVFPWQIPARRGRDEAVAVAGLLAILLPVFLYDSTTPFPGLAAMPPVLGTAAVIFATASSRDLLVGRALSLRPVVFVGLISYSLYLWHWPVIVFVRTYFGEVKGPQVGLAFACSLLLAVLSWRFVETPFRQHTFLTNRRRVFGTACLTSAATVAVSLLFIVSGGLPARFPNYSPLLVQDTLYPGQRFRTSLHEFSVEKLPVLGVKGDSENHEQPLDFLVWGDSHAMMLCEVMDQVARQEGVTGRVAASEGQVPGPDIISRYNNVAYTAKLMEWMRANRLRNLVLVNRWSNRTNGLNATEAAYLPPSDSFLSDGAQESQTYEDSAAVLQRSLQKLSQFCEQHGITLWIIRQVPEINERSPAKDQLLYAVGRRSLPLPDQGTSIEEHRLRQERVNQILASISSPAVRVLDPAPYLLSQDGYVTVVSEGRSCYFDEDHLTSRGAGLLVPLLSEMFAEMKAQQSRGDQMSVVTP